jgi:hypothetical protein
MFNESIRWMEQFLLDTKIGGEAALFFNIARGAVDPPTNLVGQRWEKKLFHDLEGGALAVARSRAGKKRADCVNGLAVAADNSANVALAQLHFKDRHFTTRNFREHHLVRVLDELADDKLEKFPHADLRACAKTRWSAIESAVRRDLFINRVIKSSSALEFCLRQNLIH